MAFNQDAIQRLTQLRSQKKFTDSDWNSRGLNPSEPEIINEMIQLMNACLDELLEDLKSNATERQVRSTLIKGLKKFKSSDYDTEEKEFICDEFNKIGSALGLNISDNLNNWLYGNILGTIINLTKKKEVIVGFKSFECPQCKLILKINVTSVRQGVPNYWIIGRCGQCAEYSLLSTGENAGGLKFENFTSIEILDSRENSEERAKTRLEQIKYFRGKN
jgi:hypothetical protein